MAKTPEEWLQYLTRLCVSAGVAHDDAESCACDSLLRYHHRRGVYPWDEPTPDERLLRLIARDIVAEHLRTLARRRRSEAEYCAYIQYTHACAPTPMQTAIENADAERFYASLPPYLRRTLQLLEAGHTPAEIAEHLGVSVNTVYAYRQELRAHFVKYFERDPKNRGARVGNYSGGSAQGLPRPTQEVTDDETTADDTGYNGVVVSDSEPCGDAPHAGGVERVQRGGTSLSPMTNSSGGCGCALTSFEKNPDEHSSILEYSLAQLGLPLRPAIPCPVNDPECSTRERYVSTCYDTDDCPWPLNIMDRIYSRQVQIWDCPGGTYYTCTGRWEPTYKCCLSGRSTLPTCDNTPPKPGDRYCQK